MVRITVTIKYLPSYAYLCKLSSRSSSRNGTQVAPSPPKARNPLPKFLDHWVACSTFVSLAPIRITNTYRDLGRTLRSRAVIVGGHPRGVPVQVVWKGQISPQIMESPLIRPNTIIVIGSSVAYGLAATSNHGWVYKTQKALKARQRPWNVYNYCECSYNSAETMKTLQHIVLPQKPDVVIIALSLRNEGTCFF